MGNTNVLSLTAKEACILTEEVNQSETKEFYRENKKIIELIVDNIREKTQRGESSTSFPSQDPRDENSQYEGCTDWVLSQPDDSKLLISLFEFHGFKAIRDCSTFAQKFVIEW